MDKIKEFISNDSVFYGLLIVLVAVTAYGLGQRSVAHQAPPQPASVITYTETTRETPVQETATAQIVVASKNGTKYHFLRCPGAKQIKEENKLTFASEAEAQAAGYTLAANCK